MSEEAKKPEVFDIIEGLRKSDDGTVWLNMFVAFASKDSIKFGDYDANYIACLSAEFADD